MNENLGIAEELTAKREAIAARLSPAARARAFPTVYARPLSEPTVDATLRATITALTARHAAAERKVAELTRTNARMAADLAYWQAHGHAPVNSKPVKLADITATFCRALDTAGYRKANGALCTFDDLRSRCRARDISWPRAVAMMCCRRLSRSSSLNVIARHFGVHDHTSVMAALRRATAIMDERPELASAAAMTLAEFSGTK